MNTRTLRRDALDEIRRLLDNGHRSESAYLRAMLTDLERRFWVAEHHRGRDPDRVLDAACPVCWALTTRVYVGPRDHWRACPSCRICCYDGAYLTHPLRIDPEAGDLDADCLRGIETIRAMLRIDYMIDLPCGTTPRAVWEERA